MTSTTIDTVGFIGLGVMGEPMCGHLASIGGREVVGFDVDAAPLTRLAESGALHALVPLLDALHDGGSSHNKIREVLDLLLALRCRPDSLPAAQGEDKLAARKRLAAPGSKLHEWLGKVDAAESSRRTKAQVNHFKHEKKKKTCMIVLF